jgi:hypothetical protein
MRFPRTLAAIVSRAFAALCLAAPSLAFTAALSISFLPLASAAAAQQAQPCTQRTIPISVITQQGQPVTGLTAANFTAKFDGKPVTVSSVALPKSPPTVLILLDVSGSMHDFPDGLSGELNLADLVVSKLPAGTPVGLALARERTVLAVAPTPDRARFEQAIAAVRADSRVTLPQGATALGDALVTGITISKQLEAGDVKFVVTDGEDTASHTTLREAVQSILAARVRIFAAVRQYSGASARYRTKAEEFGLAVGEASGGDAFEVPNSRKEWPAAVAFQAQEITNFYRITLALPAPVEKPQSLKLDLTGLDKHSAKHFILRYPQQLVPCEFPRR